MRRELAAAIGVLFVFALKLPFAPAAALESQVRVQMVAPATTGAVRDWDNTVNSMLRTRELQLRLQRQDTLVPGRTLEQLDQYHDGVRVWGGSMSRQLNGPLAVSVFGALYSDIAVDVRPDMTREDAKSAMERASGTELGPDVPELVVLPLEDGSMKLAWTGEIMTAGDHLRLFIDAKTGDELRRDSLIEGQAPDAFVGHGVGVLGDTKKLSTEAFNGSFITFDTLRPPDISTFDLRSNLTKVTGFLNGVVPLASGDYAFSANNDWTDPAVVDAHAHASETYDYYFKRFGRQGLDNANHRIWNIVHPVGKNNIFTASSDVVGSFYLNAFYFGGSTGVMVYGEGLPAGFYVVSTGQHWDYMSGGLDVVAHELTHGVTAFTSNLLYQNESGALNEAFSDIMGTSAEFFYQPAGTGKLKADYLIGEDVVTAYLAGAKDGLRSLQNPSLFGDPDHYTRRYIGTSDNGGVHTNSLIPGHAFYLAIEGGTNKTSGLAVQGVGAAHRDQMEKVFYRAFAQLMPSNANFSMARAITLQAAADLYGVGSAPYNAVRDAWTAVGVN